MNEAFEGHVYLDHHHPPIVWNIVRGGFSSVGILSEREGNFAVSVSLASMLQNSSANRLESELALEVSRQVVAPSSVSRMKGLFVFDDIESVAQVWEANKWGTHFRDEYLADVGVYARNSSRVDANWIAEIIGEDGALLPDWQGAAASYWRGIPHTQRIPIWERIVDGTFCVWSMRSKQVALKEIEAIWPGSIGLLVHSMNCFGVDSPDGQVFPGLTIEDGSIKLEYFLRMMDSQHPEFIERLERLPRELPERFAGYPDPELLRTPDLTGYTARIPIEDNELAARLVALLALVRDEPRNTAAEIPT